jgi:hypothetical protein
MKKRKFKNIFQELQTSPLNIGWELNITENVNSVIIYNNGGGFLVVNTGLTITPLLSPGMKFELIGNKNEIAINNNIRLYPLFGFPNVTIISKVYE